MAIVVDAPLVEYRQAAKLMGNLQKTSFYNECKK